MPQFKIEESYSSPDGKSTPKLTIKKYNEEIPSSKFETKNKEAKNDNFNTAFELHDDNNSDTEPVTGIIFTKAKWLVGLPTPVFLVVEQN